MREVNDNRTEKEIDPSEKKARLMEANEKIVEIARELEELRAPYESDLWEAVMSLYRAEELLDWSINEMRKRK